jgi:hypothetical protein
MSLVRHARHALFVTLVVAASPTPARAAILNGPGPVIPLCAVPENSDKLITVNCFWDQTLPGSNATVGATNWKISITDSAVPPVPAVPPTNLSFELQHLADPDGNANLPGQTLSLKSGPIPAGSQGAGAGTVKHNSLLNGTAVPGADVYRYKAAPPPVGVGMSVLVFGRHFSGAQPLFGWSFVPPAGVAGGLAVSESTANGTKVTPVNNASVGAGNVGIAVPLPGKFTGNEKRIFGTLSKGATDYTVRYTVGDPFFSDTTLAFVTGSPGSFEEGDLGLFTAFFTGDTSFLVPELFDAASMAGSSMQDLFVAVDLTQWLSFPQPFSPGGPPIHFSNGITSGLPGFLVARPLADGSSPITFDPTAGFTAPDAFKFTGDAVISGIIDGETVPAPAPGTLTLVGAASLGWLGLTLVRARRTAGIRRRRTYSPRPRRSSELRS